MAKGEDTDLLGEPSSLLRSFATVAWCPGNLLSADFFSTQTLTPCPHSGRYYIVLVFSRWIAVFSNNWNWGKEDKN